MGRTTFYIEDASVTSREAETTAADFDNGVNLAGSNAPGVGINIDGGTTVGTPEQFTLLDQYGNARTTQTSQHIGGGGFVPRTGNQAFTWDSSQALYTASGAASSGGQAGTLPDGSIRAGNSPTNAAKAAAEPSIDGTIVAPQENAALLDLATGWEAPGTP